MTTPRIGFGCWWDPLSGFCKGYMRKCAPAPCLSTASVPKCRCLRAPAPSCLLTSSPSLLLQLQQAVAPARPTAHALILEPEPEQFSFCPFFFNFSFYFMLHFPSNLSTPAPF